MRIHIIEKNGIHIAEIASEDIEVRDVQDVLDLMANCDYQGARNIIIDKKNITPDFFDLSTGIAGEMLQKFSNYRMKLAIVGDFSEYTSKSLKDFIYESNKTGRIHFVSHMDDAVEKLTS